MNVDRTIRASYRVALFATIALIYWVAIFFVTTLFDLKVVKERTSTGFLMSILGILAILAGALILNVTSNLSAISAALTARQPLPEAAPARRGRWGRLALALSFPLVVGLLFAGDHLSSLRKQQQLIASAQRLVAENPAALRTLGDYRFSADYVKQAQQTLNVLNKIDKHFPEVIAIVPDTFGDKQIFLGFGGRWRSDSEDKAPRKDQYIVSTTQEERDYLARVFSGDETKLRFNTTGDNYELYFPLTVEGRKLVLYFSDYQRYGKFSS